MEEACEAADEVVVAVSVIDPEGRVEVDAGVKRGNDVFHHVLLRQAEMGRFNPVHVQLDLGIIELLLNAHVDASRYPLYPLFGLSFNRVGRAQVVPLHLDVDRRGEAEVERRRDQAACVEGEFDAGNPPTSRLRSRRA